MPQNGSFLAFSSPMVLHTALSGLLRKYLQHVQYYCRGLKSSIFSYCQGREHATQLLFDGSCFFTAGKIIYVSNQLKCMKWTYWQIGAPVKETFPPGGISRLYNFRILLLQGTIKRMANKFLWDLEKRSREKKLKDNEVYSRIDLKILLHNCTVNILYILNVSLDWQIWQTLGARIFLQFGMKTLSKRLEFSR
jgi:hypothetical protein